MVKIKGPRETVCCLILQDSSVWHQQESAIRELKRRCKSFGRLKMNWVCLKLQVMVKSHLIILLSLAHRAVVRDGQVVFGNTQTGIIGDFHVCAAFSSQRHCF